MTLTQKSNLRGVLFALLAFAVFATHDVFVKYLGGSYATFQIVFFSVLFAFPMVTLMLMRDPRHGNLIPVHPWWTALRTLAAVVTGSSAFYAFSVLPLAQVYAILFAAPLIITLLAIPVLGERVGVHRGGAVVLGLAGVLVVLRPGSAEIGLGHIAALTAALGSATAAVVVRKIGRDERSTVLLLYPMMANFLVMGAILPFVYEPVPLADLGILALISVLGLTGGLLTIAAYKAADAAIVAPMQYSQILWASAYGIAFFDETPDRFTVLGAGLVILSGIYIVARESMAGISNTRPVQHTRLRPETGTSPRTSTPYELRRTEAD